MSANLNDVNRIVRDIIGGNKAEHEHRLSQWNRIFSRYAYTEKYKCFKSRGRWRVRHPVPSLRHFDFPSYEEAILHIRAHLRMDAMGVPRG